MKKAQILISIILILCVGAGTAFGVMNFTRQSKMMETLEKLADEEEDSGKEDDVTIAGEYKIVSTKAISDAYISGDTSALDDRQKETLDMAEKVIDEIITDGMNDYEKETAVYKYLTKELKSENGILTVIPVTVEDSDNPFGVLKNHSAVCVGYATTFRLFMQMLGIECKVVHSSDLTHSWDLVKLDDEWYHTDCYMDADSGSFRNFNMNDEICSQSHEWNREFVPTAKGIKYNPSILGAENVKDIYAIPGWIYNHLENNDESFSCTFDEKITSDNEKVAAYIVNTITEGLNMSEGENGYIEATWVNNADGEYVLCVYNTSYEDNIDLDDDEKQAADDAIAEYFDYLADFGDGEFDYGFTSGNAKG